MWVVIKPGSEPIVLSNDADDAIGQFVAATHPGASVYVCRQHGAFAAYAAHVNAQKVVMVQQPGTDEDGKPITVTVSDWKLVGNTAKVDGDMMRLINAVGKEVGKLPLEPVT